MQQQISPSSSPKMAWRSLPSRLTDIKGNFVVDQLKFSASTEVQGLSSAPPQISSPVQKAQIFHCTAQPTPLPMPNRNERPTPLQEIEPSQRPLVVTAPLQDPENCPLQGSMPSLPLPLRQFSFARQYTEHSAVIEVVVATGETSVESTRSEVVQLGSLGAKLPSSPQISTSEKMALLSNRQAPADKEDAASEAGEEGPCSVPRSDVVQVMKELEHMEGVLADERFSKAQLIQAYEVQLKAKTDSHARDVAILEEMLGQALGESKLLAAQIAEWEAQKQRRRTSRQMGNPASTNSTTSSISSDESGPQARASDCIESGSESSDTPILAQVMDA